MALKPPQGQQVSVLDFNVGHSCSASVTHALYSRVQILKFMFLPDKFLHRYLKDLFSEY